MSEPVIYIDSQKARELDVSMIYKKSTTILLDIKLLVNYFMKLHKKQGLISH